MESIFSDDETDKHNVVAVNGSRMKGTDLVLLLHLFRRQKSIRIPITCHNSTYVSHLAKRTPLAP